MFKKRIFLFLLMTLLNWSCEEAAKGGVDKAKETAKAETDRPDSPALITLKPESVKKMDIKIETVSLKSLKAEYAFSGQVDVNETRIAHVGPRIPGRAVDVYANLGNYVKKGDRLAVLDSPELGDIQSNYLKTTSNLNVAERSYERARMLLDGKVISAGEFQKREAEYHSAKADAKATEDRLHLVGMTDAEISSIGKAHTIDSRVAIYAPLSGTVIEKHLAIGEVVESIKSLFVIADISNLWVIADIPEKDIPKIKKGQEAAITVSAYPERIYRGKISYISDLINQEARTVKVRAEVENKDGTLKPGMFATMKISAGDKAVIALPESAIQRNGEKSIVFIAKGDNQFEERDVDVGASFNGFHEIISGIKEGEKIVVKGTFTLKSEGMKSLLEGE